MSFLPGTFETFSGPNVDSDPTPVRIRFARFWAQRQDEAWIYAEYARQGDDGHPFRQRILRVRPAPGPNGGVELTAYQLPGDPSRYVGEWRKAQPFAEVSPQALRERVGCGVHLVRQMEMILAGGTAGTACRSDVPGVHHEHWDFQFTSSSMRTWETLLDASGKQVGGPPGAWETRRIAREPK
jgi:hypothetical protein